MKKMLMCMLLFVATLGHAQLLPISAEADKAEVEARRISEAQKIKSFDREMTEQAAKKAKEMYIEAQKQKQP